MMANGALAGIGSGGEGGEVQLLKFSGNTVLTCNANVTQFPVNASSIVFSNGSFLITTPRNRLFGISPSSSDFLNLVIVYWNVTSEESELLSKLNTTLLQIGNVTIPQSSDWMVCVSGVDQEECHQTGSSVVKSLIVSIPSEGNYSMKMYSDVSSGVLETEKGVSIFVIASARSFVSEAHFLRFPATPHASASPAGTASSAFADSPAFHMAFVCLASNSLCETLNGFGDFDSHPLKPSVLFDDSERLMSRLQEDAKSNSKSRSLLNSILYEGGQSVGFDDGYFRFVAPRTVDLTLFLSASDSLCETVNGFGDCDSHPLKPGVRFEESERLMSRLQDDSKSNAKARPLMNSIL
jgi:hypothetical protein